MHSQTTDLSFDDLRRRLLQGGVSPRCVRRTLEELHDHLEDIQAEGNYEGNYLSLQDASRRLGDLQHLVEQVLIRPELKSWIYRYPKIARLYMPLAYLLLLPAAPLFAGAANPSLVFRWSAAFLLSAAVTAAMLLLMELSITLT